MELKNSISSLNRIKGFTLIELILVLLITAVLAATVIPNISFSQFRQTGAVQQGTAAIRMAQKLAISSGCQVDVVIGTSSCTLNWNGCTAAAIPNPASGNTNFCLDSNPGVSPAVSFSFNDIGEPITGQQTIVFGNGSTINVEANTGFIYE